MAKTPTTTYRFAAAQLQLQDAIAGRLGVTRAEAVRQAVNSFDPDGASLASDRARIAELSAELRQMADRLERLVQHGD